jgi:hypothetical protein
MGERFGAGDPMNLGDVLVSRAESGTASTIRNIATPPHAHEKLTVHLP